MTRRIHIGVLLGAGVQLSSRTRSSLSDLINDVFEVASKLAIDHFGSGDASVGDDIDDYLLTVCATLMRILEDSQVTNAGRGSELTRNGTVECDASMMLGGRTGCNMLASVAAVPEIEHPSDLCKHLLLLQKYRKNRAVSVPNFLAGTGARDYGTKLGLSTGDLITQRAQENYERWSAKLSEGNEEDLCAAYIGGIDKFLDTVGLIIIYGERVCVSSSSGGSLLKDPGRVGPAAIIGSGCDIADSTAAVCSGFGEDINSMRLAHRSVTTDTDLKTVVDSDQKANIQRFPPEVGILRASCVSSDCAHFEWYHTTASMTCGFGFVSASGETKFKVLTSKKPGSGGFKSC